VDWVKKSARLHVAEVHGRVFRIEKTGNAHVSGAVLIREVNDRQQDLQRGWADGLVKGRKIVEEWLKRPRPETVLPPKKQILQDLTLGQGHHR
jgi:hypothetical protein